MKQVKSIKKYLVCVFMLGALASVAMPALWAQAKQEKLTAQQLKELIANAKTPADHQKIADYYQQEAARLKQDAETHRTDAAIYGKGQGMIHCTNLAKFDEQAAKEANALASMHEEMAKAAK